MAVLSTCALLGNGQDQSCINSTKKYFQQAVIVNRADISSYTITKTDSPCAYNVSFALKAGKTGYRFTGPESGNSYFGNYSKSKSDLGFVQYSHLVQLLVAGATEQAKCILDSLDKGSFVVAIQLKDGTVEIYGIEFGLSTADYTYDLQANGGATAISLQSDEAARENLLPLVYKSETPGGEAADFDSLFANS